MKFAVVDLETTGALSSKDRIIEIGIVIIHNGKIVDTYDTLINPDRAIPPFIARMTGISNEDVKKAPRFFEVAKDIVLKLKGHIFVAHNVNFDYNFLKSEFQQLGYTFTARRLCTIQLSRRLYPEYKSHGLSKLVKRFGLTMTERHRALGDAKATAEFLLKTFEQKTNSQNEVKSLVNFGLQTTKLPEHISIEILHQLPEKPGVYFLLDEDRNFAYIGKSDNIKRRIFEHFSQTTSKTEALLRKVHFIDFELTPGNLIALLKEDQYIKKYNPPINKAQKRKSFPYVIVKHTDNKKTYFKVHAHSKAEKQNWQIMAEFASKKHAFAQIENISKELNICACEIQKKSKSKCWMRQIGSCSGHAENTSHLEMLEDKLSQYFSNDQVIWEKLPDQDAIGFIKIESGLCTAYGKIEKQQTLHSMDELSNHTKKYCGTTYTNKIIFRELSTRRKKYKITNL